MIEGKKLCEDCPNSVIAETIDEASDFAKENPEIAKEFFNKVGWGIPIFFAFAGITSVTWGIYFLIK